MNPVPYYVLTFEEYVAARRIKHVMGYCLEGEERAEEIRVTGCLFRRNDAFRVDQYDSAYFALTGLRKRLTDDASNPEWKDWKSVPDELRKVQLIKSSNHQRNFIDCVKSRERTITPVEVAHHSAIPGHLGLISMLVGRKIKWDAASETIIGDAEASKLLSRGYRHPWKLR